MIQTLVAYILYWCALLLMWTLKKDENMLFVGLSVIYIVLQVLVWNMNVFIISIMISVIFTMVAYISSKHYNMWKHNYTKYTIPTWLPVAFGIFTLCVLQVNGDVCKYMK